MLVYFTTRNPVVGTRIVLVLLNINKVIGSSWNDQRNGVDSYTWSQSTI